MHTLDLNLALTSLYSRTVQMARFEVSSALLCAP